MAAEDPWWSAAVTQAAVTSAVATAGVTEAGVTEAGVTEAASAESSVNLNASMHMQILYGLIGLLGICGNSLVAAVLLHFKATRKTLTNMFIINQCVIDATSSLFIVLSTLLRDVGAIPSALGQELFCRLWLTNLPIWGLFVSSTYNMVGVTYERYYAVLHPLSHHRCFTRNKACLLISGVWLVGPAFNAAYMIPTAGMKQGECTVYSIYPNVQWQTAVGIVTVLLQYFIPLGLVIYAYVRIAIELTRAGPGSGPGSGSGSGPGSGPGSGSGSGSGYSSTAGARSHKATSNRDMRIARARQNVIKTLALVCACFCLCWSCNQIYYTMYNMGFQADFNGTFYHFTVILVFCNCCINPLAYAAKYEQFQRGFRKIFCRQQDDPEDLSTLTRTTGAGAGTGMDEAAKHRSPSSRRSGAARVDTPHTPAKHAGKLTEQASAAPRSAHTSPSRHHQNGGGQNSRVPVKHETMDAAIPAMAEDTAICTKL